MSFSFTIPPKPSIDELKERLIGEWVYQYSWVEEQKREVELDEHCPTYKMVFSKCDDSDYAFLKKLKLSFPTIVEMIQNNILEDLKCQTFSSEIDSIDTYYPVAYDKEKSIGIANYGRKNKSSYHIAGLNTDTLVIYDGKNYKFDNKYYSGIRHVYLRRGSVPSCDCL